ncbi:MAG TPA: molybdopterin molybdenumtransferase MoeA [Acidimicrobiales bacterium]|nr:molybdopterin molybdenumtransferase MoeA [Acidimicrobiales bacterium]
MIPLSEAREHVLGRVGRLPVVGVPVPEARGYVTAEDIFSPEPIPAFANTAMDGFAVRAADVVDAPVELDIVGTIAAGAEPGLEVGEGQAARIMTGAVIPEGADAVVMVELTEVHGDRVRVTEAVARGNHIRLPGDDIASGEKVFEAGTVLTPGHLGVLSSLGLTEVRVYRRPRVGVLSTGDELVEGPGPLRPGQIRDSNRRTLLALAEESGFEAVDLGLVVDDEVLIERAIRRGVGECDALMTSGGVSMGDFDFVKAVLSRIGDMRWMQIAIKPAKPFAFGTVDGIPVFGLPGNPVSSMVSFELLARPALRSMMGHPRPFRVPVRAVAAESLNRHADGKTHFLRVVMEMGADGRVYVRSAGGQGSHMLAAMARADALAVVPDGTGVPSGAEVDILVFGE